jgi:hypothetical protein
MSVVLRFTLLTNLRNCQVGGATGKNGAHEPKRNDPRASTPEGCAKEKYFKVHSVKLSLLRVDNKVSLTRRAFFGTDFDQLVSLIAGSGLTGLERVK